MLAYWSWALELDKNCSCIVETTQSLIHCVTDGNFVSPRCGQNCINRGAKHFLGVIDPCSCRGDLDRFLSLHLGHFRAGPARGWRYRGSAPQVTNSITNRTPRSRTFSARAAATPLFALANTASQGHRKQEAVVRPGHPNLVQSMVIRSGYNNPSDGRRFGNLRPHRSSSPRGAEVAAIGTAACGLDGPEWTLVHAAVVALQVSH